MTLRLWPFDVAPTGTTLTTANVKSSDNVSASTVTVSSGTATIQSSDAFSRSGGYSVQVAMQANAGVNIRLPFAASNLQGAVSLYRYLTAPAGTSVSFMTVRHAAGVLFRVCLTSTNNLQIQDSTGTALATGNTPVIEGQWNRYEVVFTIATATTGNATVRVYNGDSTTPYVTATATNVNLGTAAATSIDLGAPANVLQAVTEYFDTVQMNDGATTEIGVPASNSVRPTAITTNPGGWTNQGGAPSPEAALADEADTTYVESPSNPAGASITVKVGALSTGDVTVKVRHQASAASPAISRSYELLQGSTVITSKTVTLPTAWTDYSFTTTTAETATITDRTALALRVTDTSA